MTMLLAEVAHVGVRVAPSYDAAGTDGALARPHGVAALDAGSTDSAQSDDPPAASLVLRTAESSDRRGDIDATHSHDLPGDAVCDDGKAMLEPLPQPTTSVPAPDALGLVAHATTFDQHVRCEQCGDSFRASSLCAHWHVPRACGACARRDPKSIDPMVESLASDCLLLSAARDLVCIWPRLPSPVHKLLASASV